MTDRVWSIGEAAELLGVATSTLRWWERRGLVDPVRHGSGQRRYTWPELRRLAMIQMWQETGLMSLDDIAVLLAGQTANGDWRQTVRHRLAAFTEQIAKLTAAKSYLDHTLECPRDHPAVDCPWLREQVDERLTGRLAGEAGR
ncbi:MerR family transcriptional regulator [Pseudonocardia acaciae]|uniref:MerR family transcriptional regulator n=1 Tax=Pseudonocardia acaciae TaxID=551276 RepID=UPI00055B8576|nr:MerR family transcriptional regulator [Pseudonocardia acaciae]